MKLVVEAGLIHRDLALRNVLVFALDPSDHKSVRVKVADYGLTKKGTYYYGGNACLPMRWMPPEALKKRKWSEKSDVWAFGVLLWELWTMGDIPFALESDDKVVAERVIAGERLPREGCPEGVYTLMELCWAALPKDRPTFSELQHKLLDLYTDAVALVQVSRSE